MVPLTNTGTSETAGEQAGELMDTSGLPLDKTCALLVTMLQLSLLDNFVLNKYNFTRYFGTNP